MKCKHCKKEIGDKPYQQIQLYKVHKECLSDFIQVHYKKATVKRKKKEVKVKKKFKKVEDRVKKESKLKLTQTVVNKFIRLRDQKKPCVSCGRKIEYGKYNYSAGHYYSRGARSDLRFNEDNIFGQCNNCNIFPNEKTMSNFKKEVIKRIGKERFEALSKREKKDYSIKTLKDMRSYYNVKIKEYDNNSTQNK